MKRKNFNSKLLIYLIVAVVGIIYIRTFKNQFTNWDDDIYILNNPFIRSFSFENIKSIFKNFYIGNYHPLTLLSYSINYLIDGLKPWTYQLFNIIFHLLNVYLVFVFIRYLLEIKTGRISERGNIISIVVALLFGINTMQVESVAWVSERKNVLYGFFYFVSIVYYLRYLKCYRSSFYIISLLMFLFSVLSKGMAVTLTLSLVVIDYYLERGLLTRRVIIEKVPYFIISLIFGIIAIKAQRESGATLKEVYLGLIDRLAIASYGFTQYIIRLVYPHRLSAYYPYPVKAGESLPIDYYLSMIVPLIVGIIIIRLLKWNKVIVSGLMFFIVNIITVLQLLPVGDAVMADRYVYVSSVGLFFIIGYYGVDLYYRYKDRYGNLIISLFVLYVYIIGLKTYQRIGVWQDSLSLWNDSIKKYPVNNDRGYLNRGNALFDNGKYVKALRDYNMLLEIDPLNSGGYIGRALVKQIFGEFDGAMNDYNTSLKLKKSYEGYLNRAVLRMLQGDFDRALIDLDSAAMLNKIKAGVEINKGIIYFEKEKYNEALACFNEAIKKEPENYKPYVGRGKCYQALGDYKNAMDNFNISLKFKETFEGYINRSSLKILLKDFKGALEDIEKARVFNPYRSELFLNSGIIEMENKNYKKAHSDFLKSLKLDSLNYKNYMYLGILKYNEMKYDSAIFFLRKCIKLKEDKKACFYLGMAYLNSGDTINGCNYIRKAIIKDKPETNKIYQKFCK